MLSLSVRNQTLTSKLETATLVARQAIAERAAMAEMLSALSMRNQTSVRSTKDARLAARRADIENTRIKAALCKVNAQGYTERWSPSSRLELALAAIGHACPQARTHSTHATMTDHAVDQWDMPFLQRATFDVISRGAAAMCERLGSMARNCNKLSTVVAVTLFVLLLWIANLRRPCGRRRGLRHKVSERELTGRTQRHHQGRAFGLWRESAHYGM